MSAASREFEITSLLSSHNEILLELELADIQPPVSANQQGSPLWLEVRERHYLDQWRLWIDGSETPMRVRLMGHLAGEYCDEVLELVVRGPEEELLYAPVMANSALDLSAPLPAALCRGGDVQLHIRVIRGGTRIWEAQRLLPLAGVGVPEAR